MGDFAVTDPIVAFLRACLDEDERLAAEAVGGQVEISAPWPTQHHILNWSSKRVLAEVESKRRIMYEHRDGYDPCDAHDASLRSIPCETLQLLALPYADRPGYDAAWKV